MDIYVLDKVKGKVKRLGGSLLCALAITTMVGCGSATNNKPSQTSVVETKKPVELTIDVTALATEIFEAGDYTDELTCLEDDMFDAVFQTVDLQMLIAKSAYVGSGASAEQIVVAEAKDEASAKLVKEELGQKLKDDISMNENYLPQEINKLENPVIVVSGKYVIMCVSNDNGKIEQLLLKKGIIS